VAAAHALPEVLASLGLNSEVDIEEYHAQLKTARDIRASCAFA
jgi:hypothetical protein